MALTTQPLKGSCSTFNPVLSLWSRGSKLKYCAPAFHVVGRKDRSISLKCRSYSSVGTSLVLRPKSKSFQISVFKGGSQYEYYGGRGNNSKSLKNSFKVSYVQHTSKESSLESPKVQNIVPAPHTAADETTTILLAIQNLFKNWLMLLRPPSQTQAEMLNNLEKKSDGIPKAVWGYFWGLDATIKLPILLLTALYLAVNIVYGSRVSKELTPLWILGPFVVALYVKMFLSICRLYAFCFNQTATVARSLHVYVLLVCDYVHHGKLKKPLKTFIFDLRYMIYNEVTRRKMRGLQGWLHEIAWPYHYKTSRFLKMLNF